MERIGVLRRENVSSINGLLRRRRRNSTRRESPENRQMELQGKVMLRDRQWLQKDQDRDHEFLKRRRIDRHQRTIESSDEEDYEDEEESLRIREQNRMNKPPLSSCLLFNKRRNSRNLRSSPVLRAVDDEIIGVPIPRRARSASAKRLHEYWNSGRGRFGDALSDRRFSSSPGTANFKSYGGDSPSSSGSSSLKKKKSGEPNSVIQDEIEFEVAEALFDLMKQSHSSNSHDRDGKNTIDDELKRLKAQNGGDDNSVFPVQNEQSVEDLKKDERIDNEKVVSLRENELPSCVKLDACKFADQTVTKADYEAVLAEIKNDVKLEIDLMAHPTLPTSPASTPKAMAPNIQERSETISRDGSLAFPIQLQEANQLQNLDFEKQDHDMHASVRSKQHCYHKEQKNQSSTSLLSFPIASTSWSGAIPHPGYMLPLQAVLPVDGSTRSVVAQPPQFKFSQPQPKKCATHQHIAFNIHNHHQLVKKSLLSGPIGAATFYGTRSLNLDFQEGQNPGRVSAESKKAKSSEVTAALSASTFNKLVPQQSLHQASANKFLKGSAFIFPFDYHQMPVMVPSTVGDTSRPAQPASAIGDASFLSNLPRGNSVNFNNHQKLPSSEAAPYMAMLQKNGSLFPVSTKNNASPPLTGEIQAPPIPFFSSSFYSPPMFNVSQNQLQLSLPHTLPQSVSQSKSNGSSTHKPPLSQNQINAKISQNKFPSSTTHSQQPAKELPPPNSSDADISKKISASVADGLLSHSLMPNGGQTSYSWVQPMNFTITPPEKMGGGVIGNKPGDRQLKSSKDRGEPGVIGSNTSTNPALNFSSSSVIFPMFTDMAQNGYQMAKQKNFHEFEDKTATGFSNIENGHEGTLQKSEISGGQSAQTGKQVFPSLPAGVSTTVPNFQQYQQQHQLIQMQKHHMQQMQQLTGTAQGKASSPNNRIPGSFVTLLPGNNLIFARNGVQGNNSFYSPEWESLPRTTAPDGLSQYAMSKIPQQLKTSQGLDASIKVQQIVPFSKITTGSLRNDSTIGSAGSKISILSSQQVGASTNGPGQKSSPACRVNVPSILSTCPGQLSELKN